MMKAVSAAAVGTFSESICWSDGSFDYYIVRTLRGKSFVCSDAQWAALEVELKVRGTASLSDIGIELPQECECIDEKVICVDLSSGNGMSPSDYFMESYYDDELLENGFSHNITRVWINGDIWIAKSV